MREALVNQRLVQGRIELLEEEGGVPGQDVEVKTEFVGDDGVLVARGAVGVVQERLRADVHNPVCRRN